MNLTFINRQFKDTESDLLLFKAEGKCELSNYLVYDKTYDGDGNETNIFPHMFRFPSLTLEKGEYVALRLHKGKFKKGKTKHGEVCYNLYWGMDNDVSIFNDEGDSVHLVRIAEGIEFPIKEETKDK